MNPDWMRKPIRLPLKVSLEDVLVWLFLIVTVSHIASFLSLWEHEDLKVVSWFQASGIDLAMARTSYLHRIYTGRKQKLWALIGLIFFSGCSFIFNFYYYRYSGADLVSSLALAAVFPFGIGLLSYLRAIRTVAEQSKAERSTRKPSRERVERQVEQHETTREPLSQEQERILALFRENPRTTLAALASFLGVSKTTASRRLGALQELGYLERNGREVLVLEKGDGNRGTTV